MRPGRLSGASDRHANYPSCRLAKDIQPFYFDVTQIRPIVPDYTWIYLFLPSSSAVDGVQIGQGECHINTASELFKKKSPRRAPA